MQEYTDEVKDASTITKGSIPVPEWGCLKQNKGKHKAYYDFDASIYFEDYVKIQLLLFLFGFYFLFC